MSLHQLMQNIFKMLFPSVRNNLPPDIIEAMLLLLPAKSLGRFKSVSKAWNSLISDRQFIKQHLRQTQNNPIHHDTATNLLLVSTNTGSLYSTKLIPHLNTTMVVVVAAKELIFGSPPIRWHRNGFVGSCNGIVLALDEKYTNFLMNTTTQKLWEVPSPPFEHPSEQNYVGFGFGYDSFTDDYKVVWISLQDMDTSYLYPSVYSLRKNSWKILPSFPCGQKVTKFYGLGGALVDHSYHWGVSSSTILAFSFVHEVFNVIRLPDSFKNNRPLYYGIVAIGGKLGVHVIVELGYELWVMHEYGNFKSWTRVCSIESLGPFKPVCYVEGSNQDIVMDGINKVFVFNIDQRRCRNVQIVGGPHLFGVQGTFVESIETPTLIVRTP